MPLPAALVAAYATLAPAAPFIGAAVVGFGIIATHEPGRLESATLKGNPERAAECIQRNVSSLNTRLVAMVQPLRGTETMGVVLKSGVVGDPLLNVLIQESGAGSVAEFRPLTPADQQPDVIARIIAGW